MISHNGALAQLVERLLCKQDVRGSNPLGSTSSRAPKGALFRLVLWRSCLKHGLAFVRDDGDMTRPPQLHRIATPEAMETWRASSLTMHERAVLRRGEDDWLSPADIVSVLVESGLQNPHVITEQAMDIFVRLVARGDVRAGRIDSTSFIPTDAEPATVIETCVAEWRALAPRLPGPGEITWLDLAQDQPRSKPAHGPYELGRKQPTTDCETLEV